MNPFVLDPILRRALEEDIGTGDVTTLATIQPGVQASAELVAKEDFSGTENQTQPPTKVRGKVLVIRSE